MAQFSLYTLLSCGIGQQADANPFQDCAVPAINSSLQFNPRASAILRELNESSCNDGG
jgi:hypothetical protein